MSEQQQSNREVEIEKLKIRLDLAEERRKAAGWLVHSTDHVLSDTRMLVARSISADDTMDAALATLDAAKQAKRAAAMLTRAEQDIGAIKMQLAVAERVVSGERSKLKDIANFAESVRQAFADVKPMVDALPTDGTGGETAA